MGSIENHLRVDGVLPELKLPLREVVSFGRVRNDQGVDLREAPGGAIKKRLPFNTRVFVSRELPGDWYFVTLDDGYCGYVYSKYVSLYPPEPRALLHKVKPNEGALQIVKKHYKGSAISWGQDERYYVNVLVEGNRGSLLPGIYKPGESADWSQTQTRADYLIWIPSLEFARSLRSKVRSGSFSDEFWQGSVRAAEILGDYSLGSAAFAAGLVHGALESVWDLLTGIIDLVEMVGKLIKSIINDEFLSDLKGLLNSVQSLKTEELVNAGLNAFLSRWNDPDLLHRWHFRGWLVGYAIAEIAVAVLTGAAALVKWAGKAGKLSKLIAKFPKVVSLAQKTTALSKRIPAAAHKKLKGLVPPSSPRTMKSAAPGRGLFGKQSPAPTGPLSPMLQQMYLRELESKWFRTKLLAYAKLTGKGPIDWDALVKMVKTSEFREYASVRQMLLSGGYAGYANGKLVLGMSRLIRKIPVLGRSSIQHELVHVFQELSMGVLKKEAALGKLSYLEVLKVETSAMVFGSPAVLITMTGGVVVVDAAAIYIYTN